MKFVFTLHVISMLLIFQPDCCRTQAAVDGGWSPWGHWGLCRSHIFGCVLESVWEKRWRSCTNPPPSRGGAKCFGSYSEKRPYHTLPYLTLPGPVKGGWSSWGDWSECSAACDGWQVRWRTCINPPPSVGTLFSGGAQCFGDEKRRCNIEIPCPAAVDGGWSPWGHWGVCSASCGNSGEQERSRTCTNPPPSGGGAQCSGNNAEKMPCNIEMPCPVDGGWSDWGDWGECSAACGGGEKERSRTCTNPPQLGGAPCSGDDRETSSCNNEPCSASVDGGWSPWGHWGVCSASCGNSGEQERLRTCTNPPPSGGGAPCSGDSKEKMACNIEMPCPELLPHLR